MKNKTQNQPKDNGNETKREMYDVFISYRHLDTKDPKKNPDHKHTTSLAWSIYQALYTEGFHAFVDCKYGLEGALPALDNSRHFIILFTADSIIPLEKYSYDKIKEMIEEGKKGEEGDGFNYARELYEIEKRINNNPETKNDVFLLNIDERTDNISEILTKGGYNKLGEIIRTPFNTDQRFLSSIDDLIKSKNGNRNRKRLRKKIHVFNKEIPWFRFSNKLCKKLARCAAILIPLLCIVMGGILYQCFSNPVVFAGGGTVQKYIEKKYGIDVNTYRRWLGWKYIHIPSTIAWRLLWDDVNDGPHRHYCPIVLSAGKINTKGVNTTEFMDKKRIAEYKLDSIPLMVQVHDKNKLSTDTLITIDSIIRLLMHAQETNYDSLEIWTTTMESGTYLEYKTILKDINLDNIVNNQDGGRKDFNPDNFVADTTKMQIILANKHYYYTKDDIVTSPLTVVSDTLTKNIKTIPLYIYTIAEVDNSNNLKLLREAKEFYKLIGCDTESNKTINTNPGSVTVKWDPKRK